MPSPFKLRIRRAKLVLVLLFAGLILLAANLVADWLGLKYLHPGNQRWYLNAYAQQQYHRPIDIVFLGTSKSRFGINAKGVSRALADEGLGRLEPFNLAQPAVGPVRSAAMLRDLIDARGCPSVVVFEASRFGFHPDGDWWRLLGDYATARDFPVVAADLFALEHSDGYLSGATRGLERFYDYLVRRPQSRAVEREIGRRGSQYARRPASFPRFDREMELAPPTEPPPKRFADRPGFDLRGSPERALWDLADSARRCSALLVLVRMPTAIALSREFTTRFEQQFRSELGQFAEQSGASFLDYNMVDLGLTTGQFRDWNHLNYDGTEVLSDHLARHVLAPLLKARHETDNPEPDS